MNYTKVHAYIAAFLVVFCVWTGQAKAAEQWPVNLNGFRCPVAPKENEKIAIYIDCKNSINNKEYRTFIDPNFDMAKAEWSHFKHNEWIVLY